MIFLVPFAGGLTEAGSEPFDTVVGFASLVPDAVFASLVTRDVGEIAAPATAIAGAFDAILVTAS